MTDPISDMLTRVRNGQMARHKQVRAPYSTLKFAIAKIMEKEGFLKNVEVVEAANPTFKDLVLTLVYTNKVPRIREMKRISKPGRRMYAKAHELPRVYSDIGIAIISTPSGVMTNKEARKRRLGGEVLCEIF